MAGILNSISSYTGIQPSSTAATLTLLYDISDSIYYTRSFYDILYGKTGTFSCTTGWDFVTGLGSPNIKHLIRYFSGCVKE